MVERSKWRVQGIGIVAPSLSMSIIEPRFIEIGLSHLESLGYRVKLGENANGRIRYMSGTVDERVSDIHQFLEDPEIDLIMFAIGGYNSNQLLEQINYDLIERSNTGFIGYSDATALLNAIAQKTSAPVFLGPAFVSFCNPYLYQETIDYFEACMKGSSPIHYNPPRVYAYDDWYKYGPQDTRDDKKHAGWLFLKPGVGEGKLVGGNMETLLALAGTPYFPNVEQAILLIEGLPNEKLAKLDRELTQLRHMGVFEHIQGLIIGQFGDELQLEQRQAFAEMVLAAVEGYTFPVVANTCFSHVDPIYTVPLKGTVRIDAATKQVIKL